MENVICGSDHAGYSLKNLLQSRLTQMGFLWEDVGTHSASTPVDYPVFAQEVAQYIINNPGQRGLLVCGSGMGMAIAANRFKGIRAVVCHDVTSARLSRSHNDANILVLGERLVGVYVAYDILETFMTTKFEGGRHKKRLDELDTYEPL